MTLPAQGPLRQLALQLAALTAVLSLAWPYYGVRNEELPWPHTALAIGFVALLLASVTRQRWWWRLMHAAFAPLAWAAAQLAIAPGWYLLMLTLLLLVYRGALTGQIPLYLSNRATAAALVELTAQLPNMRFADLGAGVGSVLVRLARARPDAHCVGVENAPAPWFAGRLRTLGLKNCDWRWESLWCVDCSAFDVVYVFLSPVPMTAVWEKMRREMPPGGLLVSNSFPVPQVLPEQVIEVKDARCTLLYCYRL